MIFDGEDDCVEPQFTVVNEYHFEVTNDETALMKLKIPHRFIGDVTKTTEEPRASGTKVRYTGSDEPHARNNDIDSYSDNDDNGDDYDYDDDSNSDGDTINDDGADILCALCDDGGNLLSCIGQCKRSFHPRKEDGRESKCKTLCFTSAELKEIDSYLCKNCEYKQHQCFKCGELEPSAEPNAKGGLTDAACRDGKSIVFECNNPTCGHFYHPKCVAKLLDPDDSDALAKRIMAGMSFTCPVHWCFQCGRMEDRTERAMQFAVCRRCPNSYHRECLPREISFGTKDKNIKQRAWKLSGIVIIYCLDHKICKATGTAERGHIKFPHTPKFTKSRDLAKKKGKMVGTKKKNIGQCSKKSTKVLNRFPGEKIKDTQKSLEHMVLQPECSAMNLKEDLQIEPSMVGAACLSGQKALKGQKKQFGSSFSSSAVGSKTKKRKTSGPKKERSSRTSCNIAEKCVDHSVQIADKLHSHIQPCNMDNLMDNAPVNKDAELNNEICGILEDKDGNGEDKSSENLVEAEGYGTRKDTSHENNEQNDVLGNIAELDSEICRILEDKDGNGKEKSSEHSGEAEDGTNKDTSHESNERNDVLGKDAELDKEICRILEDEDGNLKEKSSEHSVEVEDGTNKDTSHENNEQNDKLGKIFVDIHTEVDQSKFKSRAERSMESGENADGHDSISGQEISMGENQMCRSMCEQELRSGKGKIASNESAKSGSGNSVVTPDHVDDNPPEKLLHVPYVYKMTITGRLHTQPEYGCDKGLEVNGAHAFQKEPNSSQCNVNPKAMGVLTSGDNSRKRRKLNKKATDVKNTDLDKTKRCNRIEDGKEAHCDDSSRQCPSNHKGLDYQDSKFGNGVPSSPQCNDENGAAEVSEYKSRHSTGPSSREILTHSTRENLSSSAMGRNSQEKPRSHSPNRQRTYHDVYGQHPAANQHKYVHEQHPATNSRKIRKLKNNATDGNNTDLDKNKRCNHIEHGKEAHCDDSSRQCLSNHDELYYQDHKFRNSVPSGSQCNDENGAAEVSEYKSRQSTGLSRREILTHSTRENSSNSPMDRNSQGKPRSHSPNRQRMRTYRDMYEQHTATNQHRYEQRHDVSYPSNCNYGLRSHVPLPPVFVPTDFDADRGYDSRSNPRGPEHGNTGWHSPSFHPRSHEYFTSGRRSPPYCPARPENVDHSRNVNNLPIHGYDEYDNFMHDGYHAVGFDRAAMHPPLQASYNVSYQPRTDVNTEGRGAAYGGRNREYRARSYYTFSSGPRRLAAVSVTDRYAPHLEQTNNRPAGIYSK